MKIQKWVVLSAAMLAIFTACGGSNKPAETTEDVQMTAEPVVEEVAAPMDSTAMDAVAADSLAVEEAAEVEGQ
ncbi:MAG: hypothetical protein KDC10_01555 [Calditrichaeota bacterium]|nr:hypothetical protein [Candidatus Cloacimonadota bacterium]MCA9786124.1 hypothetical protein [Candidatus Cloacimonadota bacterium]MCB1045859.1 hypothetical protein [Calditrichota bacterium]MCB9473727.1 hypothetical protein [Candidatus Delongbacteria bacterium]